MKLRKLSKVHKRLLSGILSAAMVLSGLPALGGSTAHAATILQNETISTDYTRTSGNFSYDSGENTAYVVGPETLGSNGWLQSIFGETVGSSFNIAAIEQAIDRVQTIRVQRATIPILILQLRQPMEITGGIPDTPLELRVLLYLP